MSETVLKQALIDRGYSRDDAKADLINQLDDIWESTDDESMKHMIEEWKRQAEQKQSVDKKRLEIYIFFNLFFVAM